MDEQRLHSILNELENTLIEEKINPTQGLPYELFLFATALLPFINVDLLITNSHNQVLLSWRDDVYYGKGWQIPGGIIRMRETIDERISKTAISEIGANVFYENDPIAVRECILPMNRPGIRNQLERSHNIVMLYKCTVTEDFVIDNMSRTENDEGYLKWFDEFPDNILECHKIAYGDVLDGWFK